ncbi:protein of unknown function [Cardinium endosymbiont cEper1 of Encarsia pergandiella]|nr:protein of unknown function [Cardinium endosymbiont cEper1 of Encarsia pergandiella]
MAQTIVAEPIDNACSALGVNNTPIGKICDEPVAVSFCIRACYSSYFLSSKK